MLFLTAHLQSSNLGSPSVAVSSTNNHERVDLFWTNAENETYEAVYLAHGYVSHVALGPIHR